MTTDVKNKKMNQNKILPLTMGVIILSLLIVIVIQAQQLPQWTHPTAQPPMGNIQMPISGWTDDETTVRLTTTTDNVGIGTATPAAGTRLDVAGRARMTEFQLGTTATPGHVLTTNAAGVGTWQAAGGGVVQPPLNLTTIPAGTTGTYTLSWDAFQICQFGTCCTPWRDCDGDGHTYGGRTDCDEGCPTCFMNSATVTGIDGRDQNCNGIVDEAAVEIVHNSGTNQSCNTICTNRGQTCASVGTNGAATNNHRRMTYCVSGGWYCSGHYAYEGNGCGDVMETRTCVEGGACNEYTNCRCTGHRQ